MLGAHYLENSWRCYLATIANYYLVCYEAVWPAILATAWLLVVIWHATNFPCWWKCFLKSSQILAKITRSHMSSDHEYKRERERERERERDLADWDEWHIELHHCSSLLLKRSQRSMGDFVSRHSQSSVDDTIIFIQNCRVFQRNIGPAIIRTCNLSPKCHDTRNYEEVVPVPSTVINWTVHELCVPNPIGLIRNFPD